MAVRQTTADRSDSSVKYPRVSETTSSRCWSRPVDVGRVDGATPYALHAQAARRALADAGLTRDVDGVASTGLGTMAPIDVAEYLGLRPAVDRLDLGRRCGVGGDGGPRGGRHRRGSRRRRAADVRLHRSFRPQARDCAPRSSTGARAARCSGRSPYGHTLISKYAMAARRHMHEYGTTLEQLAEVAVSARANAGPNPEASSATRSRSTTCCRAR